MKPLIACDIDDVLVPLNEHLALWHNERFGSSYAVADVVTYNLWEIWGCSKKEMVGRILEFYDSPAFNALPPMAGAYDALTALRDKARFIAVTSRPSSLEEKTCSWIDAHLPNIFEGVILTDFTTQKAGKGEVCSNLGATVMIEDCMEYALQCKERGIPVVLFDKPWNQGLQDVTRISNWPELPAALRKYF